MLTTSRAFCGEMRTCRASAFISFVSAWTAISNSSFATWLRLRRLLVRLRYVPFERAGRGEFSQLVTHHVFRHVDRNELLAVVDRDRVTDEFGQNRRAT